MQANKTETGYIHFQSAVVIINLEEGKHVEKRKQKRWNIQKTQNRSGLKPKRVIMIDVSKLNAPFKRIKQTNDNKHKGTN